MTTGQPARPRVALLTDAGDPVIRAAALRLGRDGVSVAVCASEPAAAASLEREAREEGVALTAMPDDLSRDDAVAGLIDGVLERFGRLDSLIMRPYGSSLESRMTRGLRALPERVAAVLRWWAACVDGAVPALSRAGGGEIVSVVSSAGRYRAAYFEPDGDAASAALAAAVDSAILGLTRQLAVELAPRKIRVNAIAMGWIRTASSPFSATPPTDEDRALVLEEIPLGRPGEPDEVAAAIAFLASDASRYLTGEVLDVNGGWWMS